MRDERLLIERQVLNAIAEQREAVEAAAVTRDADLWCWIVGQEVGGRGVFTVFC